MRAISGRAVPSTCTMAAAASSWWRSGALVSLDGPRQPLRALGFSPSLPDGLWSSPLFTDPHAPIRAATWARYGADALVTRSIMPERAPLAPPDYVVWRHQVYAFEPLTIVGIMLAAAHSASSRLVAGAERVRSQLMRIHSTTSCWRRTLSLSAVHRRTSSRLIPARIASRARFAR